MKKKLSQGYTLIELIIYMGLLSILVIILTGVFSTLLDRQLESQSTSSVDQDGRYILARLNYDSQAASQILAPSVPGSTSGSLQIRVNSIDYTYSLNNGNLQIASASAVNTLNSSNTSISNLSFQRLGDGDNDDTVRMNFTINSRVKTRAGETRSFQTTLGLP